MLGSEKSVPTVMGLRVAGVRLPDGNGIFAVPCSNHRALNNPPWSEARLCVNLDLRVPCIVL